MTPARLRIVIAGAASLRGREVADALGRSALAAADVRLLDEHIGAPILAAAADEATVVLPIAEDSFEATNLIFFTGSPAFTVANVDRALAVGAAVVDMSGVLGARRGAQTMIPTLDNLLPRNAATGRAGTSDDRVYISPGAAAMIASWLAAAFAEWRDARLTIVLLRPASERGSEAVEELESQTVKLLSFQPLPKSVFDGQVAFNLVDRYGVGSSERLADVLSDVEHSIRAYLDGRVALPAVQIIQAPAFYGYTFSAFVEFAEDPSLGGPAPSALESRLTAAGFQIRSEEEEAPSNVAAAGESTPILARPVRDANRPNGYWLWGAVDNIRLAAANAVAIAEKVLTE